jgi:hypothetical protein
VLNHPLVHDTRIDPDRAAHLNLWYKQALDRIADASRRRDWESFVFVHTRPYLVDAFLKISFKLTNKKYWKLLADVWVLSENIWQKEEALCELWNEPLPCKSNAMNAKERKAMKALPDEITIYRGACEQHSLYGMSWTLDRDKAIWFAKRSQPPYVLLTARAKKSDAHALLLRRRENEIVIDQFQIIAKQYVT